MNKTVQKGQSEYIEKGENGNGKSFQCDSCHGDSQKKCKRWADHSADCGYSSGTGGHHDNVSGTGSSSLPSSPDGSEVACSDGFCNGECTGDGCTDTNTNRPNSTAERKGGRGRDHRTLEQMLEEYCSSEEDCESYIPLEIVKQFQAQEPNVMQKRQELRETLKNRFAQLLIAKH